MLKVGALIIAGAAFVAAFDTSRAGSSTWLVRDLVVAAIAALVFAGLFLAMAGRS